METYQCEITFNNAAKSFLLWNVTRAERDNLAAAFGARQTVTINNSDGSITIVYPENIMYVRFKKVEER